MTHQAYATVNGVSFYSNNDGNYALSYDFDNPESFLNEKVIKRDAIQVTLAQPHRFICKKRPRIDIESAHREVSNFKRPNTFVDEFLWTNTGINRNSAQEKLQNLSYNTKEIIAQLEECDYKVVVNDLTTLNLSIRNAALSGDLPEDVADTLGDVSSSIDSCIRTIYEVSRTPTTTNKLAAEKAKKFLVGIQNLLMKFSEMK
jgi:hypothetical protein